MVFDDIIGQSSVVKSLKNSISGGRIAHAYLFCGPDGVGKSIAASIFASALNCRKGGNEPCGICPSCLKANDGNHPDIIHTKTQKASISVEDIRNLQMDMQMKPYEDGVKVFIIHDSEKMTEQAQNALLKILEEPPSHVIIILLTSNRYSLLSTIVSRCRILNFSRAPEDDIENYLKNVLHIPDKQARTAAAFSGGILKEAIEFLNDGELRRIRDEVIEISINIRKKDRFYAMSRVEYFIKNKDRANSLLDVMMSWFRDITVYKECGDFKYLMNPDRYLNIADECKSFTSSSLYNIIGVIKTAMQNIESNVNYQLVIETMLFNMQEG